MVQLCTAFLTPEEASSVSHLTYPRRLYPLGLGGIPPPPSKPSSSPREILLCSCLKHFHWEKGFFWVLKPPGDSPYSKAVPSSC